MDDEALIEFFSNLPAYKILPKGPCHHWQRGRTVDGQLREVKCQACGEKLDPFDCLMEMAKAHERIASTVQDLRTQETAARARLGEILREEANARARLKRLKGT